MGFCTIITSNYLPFAETLYDSLIKFDTIKNFSVLVVDERSENSSDFIKYSVKQLANSFPEEFRLIKKYKGDAKSSFRWALKPLFLKFLLQEIGHEKLIYIDPDIHFYSNPNFLFEELDNKNIILTPHWRSRDPFLDRTNFELLFTEGLYNAGFFGCNNKSIPVLDWWLKACSYKMARENGMYDDQAYLNLMPIYFSEHVKVITHKGCNVAGWNKIECKREKVDNKVLIESKYPIIFIHFTQGTVYEILKGTDSLLKPYLSEYENSVQHHIPEFSFKKRRVNQEKTNFFKFFHKRKFLK